ncbi:hypothetical protein CPG37_08785 [Malaciobacter canalis]|jgi:diguanylate cyclase (GGDEF)-like protein|uniref:diguanylate cyclase n=2 Tax=Malaciobacter canalis TaxID=1912871 RepID=A0ABX4LPX5_9BACT|nr:hypothetical protein CPG37_08785 [Malaciobacter canalis]
MMSNRLKEVTFLTVNDLKNEDIILPSKYSQVFENHANSLEVNIEDENVLFKDLHEDNVNIDKIVRQTNDNLSILYQSTDDARTAILNKDDKSLQNIYGELAKMKSKINLLQKELFSDSLTKAFNRKWFMDYYLINKSFPEDGALAFIDLNKFKYINDTFGHLVGDQVLKYLVDFLKKEFKDKEIKVLRYAGDEFIVLFNQNTINQFDIKTLMTNAQKKLARQKLKTSKFKNIQFSFSFGLVPFKKDEQLEKIVLKADELMYKNKKALISR